jgi:hypothetical protein
MKLERANLAGQIVHLALELITKELARADCTSVRDPLFPSVLKQMGGFTEIINKCTALVIDKYKDNPRVVRSCVTLASLMKDQESELRERVQILTSRLLLQPRQHKEPHAQSTKNLVALGNGLYSEVKLQPDKMDWVGYADLLSLSNTTCEIVDFKSGERNVDHEFQICVYSLLWSRDTKINPHGRLINKLTLSYPSGEVEVKPLSPSELDQLEGKLMKRTQSAIQSLHEFPPRAKPSFENCRYCGVRQLCDTYWRQDTQQQLSRERAGKMPATQDHFHDFEVEVKARRGISTWDALVRVSGRLASGTRVLVGTPKSDPVLENILAVGNLVRILRARLLKHDDAGMFPLISLGGSSEAFLLERS